MRAVSLRGASAIGIGALAVFAVSCQLVSGVRNDGELESSSSAGGSTSSSTAGSTSSASSSVSASVASSSSSAMVPMCGGYVCYDTCVADTFCVTAKCKPSAPFEVFTSTDLQGHPLADALPSIISNGQLVVGVVDTVTNTLLVRGIGPDTTVTPTASYPLGADARFEQGRFGSTKTVFQGRMNGEIVEIRFSFGIGDAVPHDPVLVSFGKPAVCTASEDVERVRFTLGENDEVSYVANCSDPGTSYKLVMGGENTAATTLASGVAPTAATRLDAYEYSKSHHLILTGDGRLGEQPHFRTGTTTAELMSATPLRLSADPQSFPARMILARNAPMPNDFLYVGLDQTGVIGPSGNLWVGTFDDPAALGGSLPLAGFKQIATLDGTATKDHFGTSSNAFPAISGGVVAATISLAERHLSLAVVGDDGVVLTPFAPLYDQQGGSILASAVGFDGSVTLVAWSEVTSGAYRVRAATVTCGAIDAP